MTSLAGAFEHNSIGEGEEEEEVDGMGGGADGTGGNRRVQDGIRWDIVGVDKWKRAIGVGGGERKGA